MQRCKNVYIEYRISCKAARKMGKSVKKTMRMKKMKGGVSFNSLFNPVQNWNSSSPIVPKSDMYPLNPQDVQPDRGISSRLNPPLIVGGRAKRSRHHHRRRGKKGTKRSSAKKRYTKRMRGGGGDVLLGSLVNQNQVAAVGTSSGNLSVYNNFMSGPAVQVGPPMPFVNTSTMRALV